MDKGTRGGDVVSQPRLKDFEVAQAVPKIGEWTVLLNPRQAVHEGEATGRILPTIEDITRRTHGCALEEPDNKRPQEWRNG